MNDKNGTDKKADVLTFAPKTKTNTHAPDQTKIASADALKTDAEIKQTMQATFKATSQFIEEMQRELRRHEFKQIPAGLIMTLFAGACGLAKANGYTLQTVSMALGQAWDVVFVKDTSDTDRDVNTDPSASNSSSASASATNGSSDTEKH